MPDDLDLFSNTTNESLPNKLLKSLWIVTFKHKRKKKLFTMILLNT